MAPKPPFLGGFGPLQGQILYWDADFWPFLQSFGQIWTPRGSFGGPILQSNRCPSTGYGPKPPVQPLYSPCTGQYRPKTTQILYWDTGLTEERTTSPRPILQSNRCPSTGVWAKTPCLPPVLVLFGPCTQPGPLTAISVHTSCSHNVAPRCTLCAHTSDHWLSHCAHSPGCIGMLCLAPNWILTVHWPGLLTVIHSDISVHTSCSHNVAPRCTLCASIRMSVCEQVCLKPR